MEPRRKDGYSIGAKMALCNRRSSERSSFGRSADYRLRIETACGPNAETAMCSCHFQSCVLAYGGGGRPAALYLSSVRIRREHGQATNVPGQAPKVPVARDQADPGLPATEGE